MRDSKQEIIHFWFEETEPSVWFQNNPAFDARIHDRFSLIYDMAADGLCNSWASNAEGALALCLVLAQFPRRLFRGQAKMFATDEKALLIAKQAVNKGFDQLFSQEKRFFIYMPFEHSEKLSDQKRNLELFKAMEDENPVAYSVAKRRYDVIEKFGRFPERNVVLERESTAEELAYLSSL